MSFVIESGNKRQFIKIDREIHDRINTKRRTYFTGSQLAYDNSVSVMTSTGSSRRSLGMCQIIVPMDQNFKSQRAYPRFLNTFKKYMASSRIFNKIVVSQQIYIDHIFFIIHDPHDQNIQLLRRNHDKTKLP